jgi:hypothetical protein
LQNTHQRFGSSLQDAVNAMNEAVQSRRERHVLWEQHRVQTLRSRRVTRDAKIQLQHFRHETETTSKLRQIAEKSEREYFALRMLQIEGADRTRQLHSRNVHEREAFSKRKSADTDDRQDFCSTLRDATTYFISTRDQHVATSPRASRSVHDDTKLTAQRLELLCAPRLSWEERLPAITSARQEREDHACAHREQKHQETEERARLREARKAEQLQRLEEVRLHQQGQSMAIVSRHQQDDARVEHLAWRKRHPLRAEAIERLEKQQDRETQQVHEIPKKPSPPASGVNRKNTPPQQLQATLQQEQRSATGDHQEDQVADASASAEPSSSDETVTTGGAKERRCSFGDGPSAAHTGEAAGSEEATEEVLLSSPRQTEDGPDSSPNTAAMDDTLLDTNSGQSPGDEPVGPRAEEPTDGGPTVQEARDDNSGDVEGDGGAGSVMAQVGEHPEEEEPPVLVNELQENCE